MTFQAIVDQLLFAGSSTKQYGVEQMPKSAVGFSRIDPSATAVWFEKAPKTASHKTSFAGYIFGQAFASGLYNI